MTSGIGLTRILVCCLIVGSLLIVAGCSNKGKYAGKLNVVVSDRLKDKGVSLEDWRYSDSDKSFGIKLRTSQKLPEQTYLTLSGPGIGQIGSPVPVGKRINEGEWIDFGGSMAFGNPFDRLTESGTITIDLR